ncbi:MAG TPA: UDP-N-acetylmuramate--L-alanine ligase [Marinilabiliaceae bacterium]|nr:UDP-N-acetylmuramate--L-alanine ligase [Marinilabiliaceae bacterium]
MVHLDKIKRVWFIGIGGIGMSALARYFHLLQLPVEGYDRTPSSVTEALQKEGMRVVFSDAPELISSSFTDLESTLVIYTPAVSASQKQLLYFQEKGFSVKKRSEVLGMITRDSSAICIAGTHGKTTISTLAAHLFTKSSLGCTAFLGGISKNYQTNFLWNETSPFVVLEADEYDRSFLQLTPSTALISAVDADHLDIYGDHAHVIDAFQEFAQRIPSGGNLLIKSSIKVNWKLNDSVKVYTYSSIEVADFYAADLVLRDGLYEFSLNTPEGLIEGFRLGIPGLLNVENAVGACALALLNGATPTELIDALPQFKGIARRFDKQIEMPHLVFIDDYAHHPAEIEATLKSVRAIYPKHYLVGAFQPHLYTRTRDFAQEFGVSLSLLDELFLLDIYPAREFPIPGIDSTSIGKFVENTKVHYCSKEDLMEKIKLHPSMIFITMGAGDIDRIVPKVADRLKKLANLNE